MNYYERHLGDYARDTGHLSMLEHGAYGLLLDRYYATEAPIPAAQAYRIARATSKQERAAVDAVLAEFFRLVDGSWTNARADAEIAKAQTKINAARENGRRGGRPRTNPNGTQPKPSGFPPGSESGTQRKAHQTPDSISVVGETEAHTTVTSQRERDPVCVEAITPQVQASIELRKRGIRCTPHNPDLLAAVAEGVPVSAICDMADNYPDKPAGYVIAAARREHAAAASKISERPAHENRNSGRKLSAVEQVEAAIRERREREAAAAPSTPEPYAAH